MIVAIVGRPNVGKSTLFNRLSRSKEALVDDQPGVTRDRLYASVRWDGTELTLIDTGGFEHSDVDPLLTLVKGQVLKAVEAADRIVFMVDGRQGMVSGDKEIGDLLRRTGKEIFLVVNKIDGPEIEHLVSDFFTLGFPRVYPLSAAHGYGLRDLMSDLTEGAVAPTSESRHEEPVRVAILGRPNVGKSSLINRILGEERLVVSEIPGTTRDAIDILCSWKGKEYLFIDTAGIRRKSRVREKIEVFSVVKALKSLDRCHVALVMLEASSPVSDQDVRICGYALERGRAVILAVNKWDLVKGTRDKITPLDSSFERQLNFISFAPRLNISALTGEGVNRIFGMIDRLYAQFSKRVGTAEVNEAIREMLKQNPPPRTGRSALTIAYATQARAKPPTFVIFVNHPEKVHFSYQRFLVNQLRERLGLDMTPVKLIIKEKEAKKKARKISGS